LHKVHGVALRFSPCPHPLTDVAHDGLAAIVDGDVLHLDGLLASGTVVLEGLDLAREGARELVEHVGGAVLLRDRIDVIQAPGSDHGGIVNGRHLRCQEGFRLVPGVDATHHGQHEVQLSLRRDLSGSSYIGHLHE